MIQKVIMRTGGYYQLVQYMNRGGSSSPAGSVVYQIEDTMGQLICHCGSSELEANLLFDALEHPVRRRAPQPVD